VKVMSELQENLPQRKSSSGLRPMVNPAKDVPPMEPTETAQNTPLALEEPDSVGAGATEFHEQEMKTVGELATEIGHTVASQPAPTEKGKISIEGSSITDATGQRASAGRRSAGRLVTYLAVAFTALVVSSSGFYLLTRGELHPKT